MVYNTNIIKSILIGEKSIQILIPNFHKFRIATKESFSFRVQATPTNGTEDVEQCVRFSLVLLTCQFHRF